MPDAMSQQKLRSCLGQVSSKSSPGLKGNMFLNKNVNPPMSRVVAYIGLCLSRKPLKSPFGSSSRTIIICEMGEPILS